MNGENNTKDFLAEIYRGAKMGVESINNVINNISDDNIKHELKYQLDRYEEIEKQAYQELAKRNDVPDDIPSFQKMSAKISIKMNTMMDSSTSHIADLLIQGNTMGVTGITKSLHSHQNADPSIKTLADNFIKLEQDNIERLKKYL